MWKRLKFYLFIGGVYFLVTRQWLLSLVTSPWVKGICWAVICFLLLLAVFVTVRRKRRMGRYKKDNDDEALFL